MVEYDIKEFDRILNGFYLFGAFIAIFYGLTQADDRGWGMFLLYLIAIVIGVGILFYIKSKLVKILLELDRQSRKSNTPTKE